MGLKEFIPDANLYEDLLVSHQIGHGALGRYRGSDLQNGSGLGSFLRSLFTRISRFATPLIRTATPHLRTALESARPHLNQAAETVLSETSKGVAKKINDILNTQPQEGSGKRKRGISKSRPRKRKSVKLKRIPPFDLPDSFLTEWLIYIP